MVELKKIGLILLFLFLFCQTVFGGIIESITNLPEEITENIFDSFEDNLVTSSTSLLEIIRLGLTSNPNVDGAFGLWSAVMGLLEAFMILAVMFISGKFVLGVFDVQQKVEAKDSLKKFVFMVVLIGSSFYLYGLMLDVSTGLSNYFWEDNLEGIFADDIFDGIGLIGAVFNFMNVFVLFILTVLRFVGVFALAVLFPVGIFLYFVPMTKSWGKLIFNLIFVLLLIPVIDVIVLIVVNSVYSDFFGVIAPGFGVPFFGICFITIINIVLFLAAIIQALIDSVNTVPGLNIIGHYLSLGAVSAYASHKEANAPRAYTSEDMRL